MANVDINALKNWILHQTLIGADSQSFFTQFCEKIAQPIGLYRGNIGMPTLHPLAEAIAMTWWQGSELEIDIAEHGYEAEEDWQSGPVFFMLENQLNRLNYRLDKSGDWEKFPLLREMAKAGCTEYYAFLTSFADQDFPDENNIEGVFTSWFSNRAGGFPRKFLTITEEILPALGIAAKLWDREATSTNIVEAYLGNDAGKRVLKGQIKRGELISIDAVIWYSDLRESTYLADNLSSQDFLDTLNAYFECTAGSILENDGQVLRFIGDAVLAIFPVESFKTAKKAADAAWQAAITARDKINQLNQKRKCANQDALDFGLGLHAGTLKYGNIGVPTRLEFSVIGPVANEVARLESLTKEFDRSVIVSESFSKLLPLEWECLGSPKLKGVNKKFPVYSLIY